MPEGVTSGMELNSYEGNANLAEGSYDTGYAKIDLSPLQDYALKKYQTNLVDYQQQQKDRAALEEKYTDPTINLFLDKPLADQLDPKLNRLKELSKMGLEKNPNSKQWYEFMDLHKELTKDNARLKAVQDLKERYNKDAGASPDQHEKERMLAYVKQLDNYKLGEEIPVYNKYFAFNDAHLPEGETAKGVMKRVNGNMVDDVEYSIYNPMDLDKKAKDQRVRQPEAYNTGEDIGHTLLEHGGVEEVNKAAKDIYDKGLRYNIGLLQGKYKSEYEKYLKANPGTTFKAFIDATGKTNELNRIYQGHEYLKNGLQYIPVEADKGQVLDNFSYSPDGTKRLNVDNDVLRAIYAATKRPPGETEKVIKSELSTKPAEIKLKEAQIDATKALTGLRGEQGKTQKSIQAKNYAAATKIKTQTKAISPLPATEVPLIGREAEVITITDGKSGSKQDQILLKAGSIPEALREKAGFGKPPALPKNASETQVKEYNKAKAAYENSPFQMRFFTPDGKDVTTGAIKKLRLKGGSERKQSLSELLAEAPKAGIVVKFIDTNGNIVGTTESIDRQTQIQNNKVNTKDDLPLGEDLPPDSTMDE